MFKHVNEIHGFFPQELTQNPHKTQKFEYEQITSFLSRISFLEYHLCLSDFEGFVQGHV